MLSTWILENGFVEGRVIFVIKGYGIKKKVDGKMMCFTFKPGEWAEMDRNAQTLETC